MIAPPGGSIPAAKNIAISDIIAASETFAHECNLTPHATLTLPVPKNWGMVIERFNWGETSRPNKLYYEIWNWGTVISPQQQEGFHCGSMILDANLDNRSTHPVASNKCEVRLWNCSSPAVDVWYEVAIWFYKFPMVHLDKIMAMSLYELLGDIDSKFDTLASKLDTLNERLRVPELVRR